MRQRETFLDGEGDAWFRRNRSAISGEDASTDPMVSAVRRIAGHCSLVRVLEVGCGAGQRAAAITEQTGAKVSGIDPSADAVAHARSLGIDAQIGTADSLPFDDGEFDAVVFGHCLCLCDREDLFRIAAEADRVLRMPGWLVIEDFFATTPAVRPYHHRSGLWTFKMDCRRLFDWHPNYVCIFHEIFQHNTAGTLTDDASEWVALSILRKAGNSV